MTKKEIVKAISDAHGLPQTEIAKIFEHTLEAIAQALLKEGRLEIRNFGVFQVKCRRERVARNPRSGLMVTIPEKFVVSFRSGKELEQRLQELDEVAAKQARAYDPKSDCDNNDLDDSADQPSGD
ncbi:MAG: HU family DNA-binding protein [Pirellulales bacterium]